jgi:hypothetical protein
MLWEKSIFSLQCGFVQESKYAASLTVAFDIMKSKERTH